MMLITGNDVQQSQEIRFVVMLLLHEIPTNVLFASFKSSFQAFVPAFRLAVNDLLQDIYRFAGNIGAQCNIDALSGV